MKTILMLKLKNTYLKASILYYTLRIKLWQIMNPEKYKKQTEFINLELEKELKKLS